MTSQLQKINPNDGTNSGSPINLVAPGGGPYGGSALPGAMALGFYANANELLWANGNYICRIDMASSPPHGAGRADTEPLHHR